MNLMNNFCSTCLVASGLNNRFIDREPKWAPLYRDYGVKGEGVIA
ncbi:hypothetical protein AB7M49_004482 [Bradyrhizobium elkanii]